VTLDPATVKIRSPRSVSLRTGRAKVTEGEIICSTGRPGLEVRINASHVSNIPLAHAQAQRESPGAVADCVCVRARLHAHEKFPRVIPAMKIHHRSPPVLREPPVLPLLPLLAPRPRIRCDNGEELISRGRIKRAASTRRQRGQGTQ